MGSKATSVYVPPPTESNDEKVPPGAGWLKQIYLLSKRSTHNTLRDPAFLIKRFFQALLMAIMIAILWWQIDNDQSAIQDRFAVVFMILLGAAFPEATTAILIFPIEREVFRRERRAGMYKLSSYFIAKNLAELPLQVIAPSVIVFIAYWTVGLPADIWIFGTFLSLGILMAFSISSFGMVAGAMFPAQVAVVMVPCFMLITLLLAGFYVNSENLPEWIGWARYGSVFFYAFKAMILNQFEDLDFYCKDGQELVLEASGTCPDGTVVYSSESICPITTGNVIVDQNEADEFSIWQYQLILLAFILACRILIYPILKYAKPRELNG